MNLFEQFSTAFGTSVPIIPCPVPREARAFFISFAVSVFLSDQQHLLRAR